MLNSLPNLKDLTVSEVGMLAGEIRQFLIQKVSASGGHLGSNLGIVELTMAIHRIFDSPRDLVLFDTGHQSYVHKIITGRGGDFDSLRKRGGIAGYPSRKESVHDVIENSHASTSLSWADGISRGFLMRDETDRYVIAVIGDGALTGGMAWEALNNIATLQSRPLIIVINDNGRSYSPTIGGIADSLTKLRDGREKHGGIFHSFGLHYTGPIDGHSQVEIERALAMAKLRREVSILHVVTEKGRGYLPAIADEAEKFHAVGVIDPATGESRTAAGESWTSVFSKALLELGSERSDIVAITAAMQGPTGLNDFYSHFPERTIDVGIAEQHAVTLAAGLSFAGMRPIVALYSTFLNRAFDQLLLDVALHGEGVTFVLDRAGITGDDGASHNGMWDMALAGIVPSLHIAAPRDGAQLKELLRESVDIAGAPSVVRFPKGAVPADCTALRRVAGHDVMRETEGADLLIIAVGPFVHVALEISDALLQEGARVAVIDPRWVKPLSSELISQAAEFADVVCLEDGLLQGGVGSALADTVRAQSLTTRVHTFGVPAKFLEHSKRADILHDLGLSTPSLVKEIREILVMAVRQRPLREMASHKRSG